MPAVHEAPSRWYKSEYTLTSKVFMIRHLHIKPANWVPSSCRAADAGSSPKTYTPPAAP